MDRGEKTGIMVLSLGEPSVIVDVTGTKGFFQTFLVSLFWCSSVLMIIGELTHCTDTVSP